MGKRAKRKRRRKNARGLGRDKAAGWTTGFADAAEDVLEDMKIPSPPHSEICANYSREKFENDSYQLAFRQFDSRNLII